MLCNETREIVEITVSGQPHYEPSSLQPKRHIEILRNMAFRPEFLDPIFHKGNTLNGLPAKKRIVADKWGAIPISHGKFDQQVNEIGEVGDCVVSS